MSYTPVPNKVYHIGLSYGAIAVYGYLLRIENRQTYKCYASYNEQQLPKLKADTERQRAQAQLSRHCTPQEPFLVAERTVHHPHRENKRVHNCERRAQS